MWKKAIVCGVGVVLLSGCSSQVKEDVCSLSINEASDKVKLQYTGEDTLIKEVEETSVPFEKKEDKEELERIAKQNQELFEMDGFSYEYSINEDTMTSSMSVSYDKMDIEELIHTFPIFEDSLDTDKDGKKFISLKKRKAYLSDIGYQCK